MLGANSGYLYANLGQIARRMGPWAYDWLRGYLTDLSAAAGAAEPDVLARQIHLLYDGAMTARSLDADPAVVASARAAATALLDTALKG